MTIKIKVSNFEGPFDLLLHLIKKSEMDIYDIKIYEVTSQYLEYLDSMKEMDLEVTSEFIVVAATLLEIKSRMLLPKEKKTDENDSEDDPRKQLVDKLLEYKKFKAAAEFLRQRKYETGVIFSKKPEIIEEKRSELNNEELLKGITMLDLYNLFNQLMNRYISKQNTENVIQTRIPADKFKIEDKMEELRSKLDSSANIKFLDVVYECTSKIEVVVTFLALLELIKLRAVKVMQEDNFKEIYVERISVNEEQGDYTDGN
jgi:segregation and condensation protein A